VRCPQYATAAGVVNNAANTTQTTATTDRPRPPRPRQSSQRSARNVNRHYEPPFACLRQQLQIEMLTGNVASQATVPTKMTTPKPSRSIRRRGDGSFKLIPAKKSTAANSTTQST
jgi:hypothetical protein